ncbi:MAG: hypothetical protein EBT83_19025, partial [Betaproteobacteria bacterium]|nr:hypothetical protein [Betaproteobacteria bacterium]
TLGLPGRGQLGLSGVLGRLDDPRFSGPVRLALDDVPRFMQWLQGGGTQTVSPLGALRRVQFDGEVTLSPDMQAARIKSLALDKSSVSGFVRLNAPERGQRARLEAQIGSDRLSVDDLPDLSPLMASLSALDTQLAVEARSITLGGETATGRLTASLSGNASGLKIERLDYDDGHDTVMRGGGQLNAEGGRLGLRIEAKRLRLLSGLVSRLLPQDLAGAVVRRASDWAPLALDLVIERTRDKPDRQSLSLTGQAAGTQVKVDGAMPVRDGLAGFAGRVQLSHASFPVLLRQFGFAVTSPSAPSVGATGPSEGRLQASVDLPRGRSDVRFEAAGLIADLDLR